MKSLIKACDTEFSIYVRVRDATKSGIVFCCTCHRPKFWRDVDCGHFISRRHYATRWEEKNAAGQCKGCNGFGAGQQHLFSRYVDARWGEGTADMLQIKKHNTFHLSPVVLEVLRQEFKAKADAMRQIKGL